MARVTVSAILVIALVATGLLLLAKQQENQSYTLSAEARGLSTTNNEFALDMYHQLRTVKPGNLFFAPASISTAFAMTVAGARGQTKEQIADALHFELGEPGLHEAFADLLGLWKSPEQSAYELRIANRLWGQKGYEFRSNFLETTRDAYGAELAQADFAQSPEEVRGEINEWVARQTNDKIRDMLGEGVVNPEMRLMLINAIYFKGKWQEPFNEEQTADMPFFVSNDRSVEVPMMYQSGQFKYSATESVQVLELPYAGDALSMIVVLPGARDGLPQLEDGLGAQTVESWMEGMEAVEVRVYLPRFTMKDQFELTPAMAALGMTDAFSPSQADFSGMTSRRDLYIGAVIHQTFVDVNEEGTEAAGATGVGMTLTAIPQEREFRADHPFLFMIRDNVSGGILFMGRLADPRA
jgi:serpin B